MIAFLTLIYTAIVVVLFRLKLIKPRPVPIACCVVAGILILGTVVVVWPLGPELVHPLSQSIRKATTTTEYVCKRFIVILLSG